MISVRQTVITAAGTPLYYRHNAIDNSRPSLLFVHGLGESGLCFLEAFHSSLNEAFNIIVPDLPGFGRSLPAAGDDYRFASQSQRLCAALDSLDIDRVHLIGHSMGGDIGTLLCQAHGDRISSFVNVEGNLAADNRFVVDQALAADDDGRFEDWLRKDFAGKQIPDLCLQWPSLVRYLASLHCCHGQAFLASVHEIDRLIQPRNNGTCTLIGDIYANLSTPRVFCWGRESLGAGGQDYLARKSLRHEAFEHAFHWVMLDQPDQFYRFLARWLHEWASSPDTGSL